MLTRDLCDEITKKNIYEKVASAFEQESGEPTEVFVSSDKSLHGQYCQYKRLPDLYLLLTRDVVSHTASLARTMGTEETALGGLRAFYERELFALEKARAPVVHIELSAFLRDTHGALCWLHDVTNGVFPFPHGPLDFNADYHHSGGNYNAHTMRAIDQERPGRRTLKVLTEKVVLESMADVMGTIAGLEIPHLV